MKTRLHNLRQKRAPTQPPRTTRPELECLEAREVPTVTYHGGAVLANVEVQALYYGSDWSTNATSSALRSQLDGFLQYIVQSGYTTQMLGNAYGTGGGSFSAGQTCAANIDKSQYLKDSRIRTTLQVWISLGLLQQPDANRLYVVYVEDNVAVQNDSYWDSKLGRYETSTQDFLGYHTAFAGTDMWGRAQDIHYAIVTYPGGTNTNVYLLSALNDMTEVTSHELAEAITDPNVGYKRIGWYDDNLHGEVGDLCNLQWVYLNGYAVQRIVDRNDQPMTPWSAGPERPVSFVLSGGDLWEYSSSGWTYISSGVSSVSDQGIDNLGRAMVDYVTWAGSAYEFHDRGGSLGLCSYAAQAKAGQGVSYVLFKDGTLHEYHDANSSWSLVWISGIQSFDAGTDKYGVNAVDCVFSGGLYSNGDAWMISDTDGWHHLMSNVQQVSGGQQGLVALLSQSGGNAYSYNEWSGGLTFLTSGARQVTTGYDATGNWIIGVVYNNGSAYLYRPANDLLHPYSFLAWGVSQLSKDNLGVIDVLFSDTDACYFDGTGQHYLTTAVQEVA